MNKQYWKFEIFGLTFSWLVALSTLVFNVENSELHNSLVVGIEEIFAFTSDCLTLSSESEKNGREDQWPCSVSKMILK